MQIVKVKKKIYVRQMLDIKTVVTKFNITVVEKCCEEHDVIISHHVQYNVDLVEADRQVLENGMIEVKL